MIRGMPCRWIYLLMPQKTADYMGIICYIPNGIKGNKKD
jgi:hypothetical protein